MAKNVLKPQIRFEGFTEAWEQRKIGDFAKESSVPGHSGNIAKKLTVKLHCKGVGESIDVQQGSCNTQYYVRKANQFIYGKQNFFNGAIGVVPNYLDNFESTKDVPAFDLDDTVNSLWLYHYLARPEVYKPFEAECTGTGSKRFHVNNFYNIELKIPSLLEQQRMVEQFERLDSLITLHQRKHERLQAVKKGLLEKMFPAEGKDKPEIRFKGFAEAWEQRKLGESVVMNRFSQISAEDLEALNTGHGDVTLLPSSRNYDWKCDSKDVDSSLINDAEIITVGRARNANTKYSKGLFIASQSHIIESFDNSKVNAKFLYYFISLHEKEFYSAESTYPMFTKMDFDDLRFKHPENVKEQESITQLLDSLDSLITLHQRKCEKLKNMKKALLEKMFC